MNSFSKKYYFKLSIGVLILALLFVISGCHSDNKHFSFIDPSFDSSENQVLHSFTDYLQTISSAEFPLALFPTNLQLYKDPVYAELIKTDGNLQFFPAILWQISAITGKAKWRRIAEHYSSVLARHHIAGELPNAETMRYVYLSRYMADRDPADKTLLLDVLSQYISKIDTSCAPDTVGTVRVERLLDNHLWFFASKETGDPVYAQLAQQHSELIYEYYFQNYHFNKGYHALANSETLSDSYRLDELQAEDIYQLAIIFYGFTILNNQQKNERYHSLCVRLAELFSCMLDVGDPLDPFVEGFFARKVDLLSKVLICHALNKLKDGSENHYRENAEKIFDQVLDELSRSGEKKNGPYSFRLYYYLFGFFQKSNSL